MFRAEFGFRLDDRRRLFSLFRLRFAGVEPKPHIVDWQRRMIDQVVRTGPHPYVRIFVIKAEHRRRI